jgi:hypothetical protein
MTPSTSVANATAAAANFQLSPGNLFRDTLTLAKRSLLKLKHNPGALVDVVLLPLFSSFSSCGASAGCLPSSASL